MCLGVHVQVLSSHVQFKCVYEFLFRFMEMHLSMDLCFLHDLVGEKDYMAHFLSAGGGGHHGLDNGSPASRDRLKELAMGRLLQAYNLHRNENGVAGWQQQQHPKEGECAGSYSEAFVALASAALMGLDPHPRSNSRQGLACLGSRKQANYPGSRMMGMLKVCLTTGCAQWENDEDSEFLWHPLLALVEASIVIPGPRCIGVTSMKEWHLPSDKGASGGGGRGLRGSEALGSSSRLLSTLTCTDQSMQGIMHRVEAAEDAALKQVYMTCWGMASRKKNASTSRCVSTHRSSGRTLGTQSSKGLGSSGNAAEWFSQVLDAMYACSVQKDGGEVGFHHYFQSAYVNPPYIQLPSACAGHEAECTILQISKTDMCMCALALAHVPFQVNFN